MSELTNQELNVWLAEHLFGFEWWRSSSTNKRGLFPPDRVPEWFNERADMTEPLCYDHPSHVPDYSGDMVEAWEILHKMIGMVGFGLHTVHDETDSKFRVETMPLHSQRHKVYGQCSFRAYAPTAPMAICLVAKAVLEAKIRQQEIENDDR